MKEPEEVPVDERAGRDLLVLDSLPPPSASAVESIGEYIAASIFKEGEAEEMSELIPADDSAGRDQLGLDSPPPHSAAAAFESIGCCEIGARCWEEVEIEVMSLIPADDNAGRDQLELVSPHPHSAAADTEVMALNLEVSGRDHLGLDSSPPSAPAATVEPIGDGIGALSLEEVEILEMSGRVVLGLDSPSPLSAAGEEMLSLNLEESEETTGIKVHVLDSSPSSAIVVDESIGGVGASSFVGGEVGDMSELGLESSSPFSAATATVFTVDEMMSLSLEGWQETAKLIFENDAWAEFSSPSSFVSAVESITDEIGDPSVKEVFELLSVDESVLGDKIGFDTVSKETGDLSLKEGKIEEVSELIYKSVVHDKLGINSSPHSAAAAVKSISKIISASNLEEAGIEENFELILVNESAEQDKLGLDYLHPSSAVECIGGEIRALSLEEGGKEETSELILVNESVEQELVLVDESADQDKLGFDYSPSLSATDAVECISEEIRAPSLEGEIEETSELITVNESVEQDKVGIDYSSSPSEAAAVECINGEIRATSLEVGEKEEMSELIPVDESVEQDKLELDYSFSPSAAAIVEYIGEEIQARSLEEGEIEKLSSVATATAAESISEETGALGLEEGEIEELSFPTSATTSATAIEFIGEEIGDPNPQNGEIEELSPPFTPATAIEFINEEIGASNLQEGEIEELFAPSAPATAVESINKEIGAPSLEEGEFEELSSLPAPATAVESIREEIMAPSLEEGEIEELSPPVAPATAADFVSKEIGAPSLEVKIEELSPPVPATTVESSNDDIGAPSLEDGEMEELSPPSVPTASVMSTGNVIRALSLEDGEIEELSPRSVGTAAIVSIGKEIRALSLEEGEIEELFDLIPTDESEWQNQSVLDSSPRPSSAIIVTTTTVEEETRSLKESEETNKPIPVHECAVLDHLGPDLSPLVPAAAVESIAEETGKPCLEEGEIEEMSEPNEEIRGGDGAYLEELEKKFEWDGTGVQENAGWGENSADPEDSQAFGENLGCSVGLKNLQGSNVEIGWEDYANLQVSEGKFEGDGNHVQESTGWGEAKADFEDSPQFGENGNGYEYPHNTGEYTGWDEPAAIWNPQVESEGVGGACQEGFASFEKSGQWSEGGGDYGGAPEHGTGWKDSAYEGGFASSENVGGEQWSEGNGNYGIPERGAGWKDNAYQGGFDLSENVGSGQQFESGGDYGGSEHVSAPSDYPQRPGEPDCLYFLRHGYCDYRSRCRFNHPLDRMPDQARPWHRQDSRQEKRFEDVTFRLLCPKDSVGGVIGKGGAIIKALQKEASASINVFPPVEESEERVISVLATESPSLTFSRAQNGVLCVFRRILEVGIERGVVQGFDPGTSVTARLLVPTNQISSLMDKDGAVITDMGTLSGANIRIIKGDKRPKCASENEEVLQINGELGNVRDALFHVTSKLRGNYFPGKTLHGTGMMDAYPPSHDEKASDGKDGPASLGFYPSVGLSHNLESLECQGTLAHNMDLVGLPTSIEQPLSPRVWAPQGSTSGYSYHGQYQKETETGQAELNLLGLPLRPGERECTHYMRTGRCKFSTTCRFHHPDSAVNGQDPSGYWNGGSRDQLASGASQLQEAYQASKTPDMSTSLWNASQWAWLFPPKRTHSTSDRNAYQSPAAPNLSGYTSKKDGPSQWQSQMEDYTERKGQPEFPDYQRHWSSASNDPSSQAEMVYAETTDSRPNCPYLLTLGTCKSGSSCKYRHSRVAC